jgi:hypothetical protein
MASRLVSSLPPAPSCLAPRGGAPADVVGVVGRHKVLGHRIERWSRRCGDLHERGSCKSVRRLPRVYVCRCVRYILTMAIEAVLQEVLKMPPEERAELVERLIDSLDDEVELSAEELAQLDEAIADADRAVERGELISADDVLAQMRQIS